MINPVATVGTFLVGKFGKDIALGILFLTARALLFGMVISFVTTMLTVTFTMYESIKNIINIIESLANGTAGGVNDCVTIVFSAIAYNIGIIDAWNLVGPSLVMILITYLTAVGARFLISVYFYITNSIVDFARLTK